MEPSEIALPSSEMSCMRFSSSIVVVVSYCVLFLPSGDPAQEWWEGVVLFNISKENKQALQVSEH